MKFLKDKSILLLLAMSLVVLPAPLEAACGMTAHPDIDPCETCLAETCNDPDCDDPAGHENDDCCEAGCQHCSLPCCSGTAMIPPVAHVADAPPAPDARLAAPATKMTQVDPDPLYHPPRA